MSSADTLPPPPTPRSALRGAPVLPRYDWGDATVVHAVLGLPAGRPVDAPPPPSLGLVLLDSACWLISGGLLLGLLLAVVDGGLA